MIQYFDNNIIYNNSSTSMFLFTKPFHNRQDVKQG